MLRQLKPVSVPSARAGKTRRLARRALAALLGGMLAAPAFAGGDLYISAFQEVPLSGSWATVTLQGMAHVDGGSADISRLQVRKDQSTGWGDGGARLWLKGGAEVKITTVEVATSSGADPRILYLFADGTGNRLSVDNLNVYGGDGCRLQGDIAMTVKNAYVGGDLVLDAPAARFTLTGGLTNSGGTVRVAGGAGLTNHGTFTNSGSVALAGSGTFNNHGTFTNSGSVTLTDSGAFYNHGTFANNGTLTSAGTFYNYGTVNGTGNITLNGGSFRNEGGAVSAQNLWVKAGGGMVFNGGSLTVIDRFESYVSATFNNATVDLRGGSPTTTGDKPYYNKIEGGTFTVNNSRLLLPANAGIYIGTYSNAGTMVVAGDSRVDGWVAVNPTGVGALTIEVNPDTKPGKIMIDRITGVNNDNFRVIAYGGLSGRNYILCRSLGGADGLDLDKILDDRSFLLNYKLHKDGTGWFTLDSYNEDGAFLKIRGINRTLAEAMERIADDGALPESMYGVAEALYAMQTEKQVKDAMDDLNSANLATAATAVRATQSANQAFGALVAGEFAQQMAMDGMVPGMADGAPRASAGGVPLDCSPVTAACERQWRGYVTAIGDFGSHNPGRGAAGSEFTGYGVLTGMERALGRDLSLGLTFSWSRHQSDLNHDLGFFRDDTLRLGTYGKWNYENFYVVSAPSAGLHLLYNERNIRFMGRTATNDRTGFDVSWYNQAGLGIRLPHGLTFTPNVAIGLTYLHEPGYTESGAGGANLRLDAQNHWSLLTNLGGRLGRAFTLDPGTAVLPEVWAGWEHEYLGTDSVRTAFAELPGYTWNAPASVPADRAVIGAGVTTLINRRYDLGARYEARLWDGGCDHQFSLRLGIKF